MVYVLGCGMVGSAIAKDLAAYVPVCVADRDKHALDRVASTDNIRTVQEDLSSPKKVKKLIKDADLVIGAVPGFMGFETLKTVIEAGKNCVDISFFPEDPFDLDNLAKKKDVTVITDCGVAPGMSNMIIGHHNTEMDIESFECLVGGLPAVRTLPFEYKAPFSPIDVLEEYTREARFMQNGEIVYKPALTDPEPVEFDGIGTLEAFNTDGLRTLLRTMNIPDMKEKTLRYPGHRQLMKHLRDMGLLSEEPVSLGKQQIKPIDLLTKLLFPLWKLEPDEEEFTVMRVTLRGSIEGKQKTVRYDLLDRYDAETGVSSMARTTGYACTSAAQLVINKSFDRKGVSPPEFVGADAAAFANVLAYQKARGIIYVKTES